MSIEKLLKSSQPKNQEKELLKIIERQQATIDQLRKRKFSFRAAKAKKSKKGFLRVIVGDSHGAHIDKDAFSAFLRDLEVLRPSEIILLGDHLDCGGFLAQHHVLGTVPETAITFEDDVAAGNVFLDEIMKRAPGARVEYLEGNHEARIEKFIIKSVLGGSSNAKYFRRLFGPETVLALDKRGIRFVKRTGQYDGLSARGTIDLGMCLARHGRKCGVHAARATVQQFGCNVIFGHTHRIDMATIETAKGIAAAWSFGCMCQLTPLYYDTDTTNWSHGYGIQAVVPGEGFLTVQVPIINGKSYLDPLSSFLGN